ncbi:uncharacterized protein LOC135498422 isoform X2 [Lineus longissimus]|uniref:uncharacterized protein LOC135498422 isoform X2 n=1 Tax=Lineus longissimus TaxID=88925 RepID=UPI002B4EDB39
MLGYMLVRNERKPRSIQQLLRAQREQQERAMAAEKAAQGHEEQPSSEDEAKKAQENRQPTPVREAMKRRKRDVLARKQKHPRPKYSQLVMDDKKQRQFNNNRSYDRLMESYGRGKNDEKLEAWLDMMYPRMDHMSATIIGMKKRLERFQSREAMVTNPKEGGVQTLMNNYKVYSLYPEVLKEKRQRVRRGSGSGSSSGSQDSSQVFNRVPKLPPIKNESRSSLGGVSEGDIHLELEKSSKNGSVRSGESRRKKGQRDSAGSTGSNGKSKDEASNPPLKLPPAPKKGILHNAPIQAKPDIKSDHHKNDEGDVADLPPKKEKKKVAIMTPIMSREGTQVTPEDGETERTEAKTDAERQEEEDEMAEFAAFRERMRDSMRRRSSVNSKNSAAALAQAAENKNKIEEIKQQILAMRRGENGGEDFELEMSRRKSLMVLMGDDYDEEDMAWLVDVEEPEKLWKDVKSCRYLRGHDPTEMQVPDGPLQEFVFWKGDFAQESSFEREQNEKKMKELADAGVEGAGYDSDVGAINSVGEATRRISLSETTKRKSMENIFK